MAMTETGGRSGLSSCGPFMRAVLSLNAGTLLAAVAGLWLLPGSNLGGDVMLMKLGLSAFMLLAALTLLVRVRPRRRG